MISTRSMWFIFLGIVLVFMVPITSFMISPPLNGQPIADSLGIPHPAVMAHRGCSLWAPEESEAAYKIALKAQVDYLELDLQQTQDGKLIAFHDDTLTRTTDIQQKFPQSGNQFLNQFTFSQLKTLDVGSWFNVQNPIHARTNFKGAQIQTLEQVIQIAESAVGKIPGLYIETKAAERFAGYEKQLVDVLTQRGWLDPFKGRKVVFQSFSVQSLQRLKMLAPQVPQILLIDDEDSQWHSWDDILEYASTQKIAGLGVSLRYQWPWYIGAAHRKKLLVHFYTINDEWTMWLLKKFGSDGIFTDDCFLGSYYYGKTTKLNASAVLDLLGYR